MVIGWLDMMESVVWSGIFVAEGVLGSTLMVWCVLCEGVY